MTDLVEVGRSRTLADATQQVLVLAAAGIECHLMKVDRDVGLYVASSDVEHAVQELACYERENLPSGQQWLPARPVRHAVDAALAYCAVLLFFFGAARRHALSVDWAAIGAAQAGLIRDGAWWSGRCRQAGRTSDGCCYMLFRLLDAPTSPLDAPDACDLGENARIARTSLHKRGHSSKRQRAVGLAPFGPLRGGSQALRLRLPH
jgi:hypothetical protein